jgi:hypothetical protein
VVTMKSTILLDVMTGSSVELRLKSPNYPGYFSENSFLHYHYVHNFFFFAAYIAFDLK